MLGSLLIHIRYWMSLFPQCSLDHINREKNQAADKLANQVHVKTRQFRSNIICVFLSLFNKISWEKEKKYLYSTLLCMYYYSIFYVREEKNRKEKIQNQK